MLKNNDTSSLGIHQQTTNNKETTPNWYERMHQVADTNNTPTKKRLNLSIFFRVWFTVALIIIIASIVVFDQLFEHVEPTSKQVIEDTLVDTGKLLSVSLAKPLKTGELKQERFQTQLDKAFQGKKLIQNNHSRYADEATLDKLSTWFNLKTHSSFRIYVTDKKGTVIYDSLVNDNAEGKDYSQWNDVYLTLRGKYGARSTRTIRDDEATSIMYVAQPITDNQGSLIGVVSVGKPVATILPYIKVARQRMLTTSLLIMLTSIFFAGLIAWWLQQSLALVTRYTHSLASTSNKPNFYLGRELNELTDTIEDMKFRLENKAYVTDYVHTLTHELKSPLTAIKASGELLAESDLEEEDRLILSHTISEQSQKLQTLIDRLLLLSKVEQPNFQLNTQPINPIKLLNSLLKNHQPAIQKRNLTVKFSHNHKYKSIEEMMECCEKQLINADEFWFSQAIDNIIANAIHFADSEIKIILNDSADTFHKPHNQIELQIINDGDSIPDYALNKVFDRYFSLSHLVSHEQAKNSTNKGTGLGLTLAKQVIEHHGGNISINNQNIKDDKTAEVVVSITLVSI